LAIRAGKRSLGELEERLKAAPGDEALRLEVATRHAWRGDPRAVTELTQIVAADSANEGKRAALALLVLGKYYYLRGAKDYTHAEATLRELERRFPSAPEAGEVAYNLGLALHAQKRDPEARQLLDAWIAAAPADVPRASAYAWLCFKNDFERPRGIEVAKQGLAVDPKDHGLWDTLAELCRATGDVEGARAAAKRALALKPQDEYYRSQLKKLGGAP
jgi:thioredoxin-like negative regulator of GroEL